MFSSISCFICTALILQWSKLISFNSKPTILKEVLLVTVTYLSYIYLKMN